MLFLVRLVGFLLGVQVLADLLGVSLVVEFEQPVQHLDLNIRRYGELAAMAGVVEPMPEVEIVPAVCLRGGVVDLGVDLPKPPDLLGGDGLSDDDAEAIVEAERNTMRAERRHRNRYFSVEQAELLVTAS